jgi:hypothetical protein
MREIKTLQSIRRVLTSDVTSCNPPKEARSMFQDSQLTAGLMALTGQPGVGPRCSGKTGGRACSPPISCPSRRPTTTSAWNEAERSAASFFFFFLLSLYISSNLVGVVALGGNDSGPSPCRTLSQLRHLPHPRLKLESGDAPTRQHRTRSSSKQLTSAPRRPAARTRRR